MVRVVEAPTLAAARGDEAVPESGHGELPLSTLARIRQVTLTQPVLSG